MIMQIFLSWEKLRARKKCAYIKFNNILIKCLLAYLAAFVMSGFLFNYVLQELKKKCYSKSLQVLKVLRFAGGRSVKAATEIWKLDWALFGIYPWVANFFRCALCSWLWGFVKATELSMKSIPGRTFSN